MGLQEVHLDDRHGYPHFLRMESTKNNSNIGEYTVTLLYRENSNNSEFCVARISNETGTPVFNQYYKANQPSRGGNWDFHQACDKIDNNWETYADKYQQNHVP